jgi:hypothetical protein
VKNANFFVEKFGENIRSNKKYEQRTWSELKKLSSDTSIRCFSLGAQYYGILKSIAIEINP